MKIERQQQASGVSPAEPGFTGDVRVAGYYRCDAPSRLAGAKVTFAPGARTPWKTNPIGQTLVVVGGRGRIGSDGGGITEVEAGDVVWWSPGERHWEGAAPDAPMTYVAVQEEDGASVAFGDAVTDDEYLMSDIDV